LDDAIRQSAVARESQPDRVCDNIRRFHGVIPALGWVCRVDRVQPVPREGCEGFEKPCCLIPRDLSIEYSTLRSGLPRAARYVFKAMVIREPPAIPGNEKLREQ